MVLTRGCWRVLTLLAVLIGAGGVGRLEGQVSPGPLARAHQTLEGARNCTSCHDRGDEGMRAKCLSCHRDVAWLAGQGRGYHGRTEVKTAKCSSCHPDHAGANFALITWPEGSEKAFDHLQAGWALKQSHQEARCADCHKPDYRAGPAARLSAGNRSQWTGLEQTCTACHEDVHRGALGARCDGCHDAGLWKDTPGFDHDTTAYPLAERHTRVSCDECHLASQLPLRRTPAGQPVPIFRPVPYQSCANCHQDTHRGAFGAECATCHSTKGFTTISGSGFDHRRTPFPLLGKHLQQACSSCHKDFASPSGRRPPSATCATCHAPDPHAGTATIQGTAADCAACHTERGFRPATLTIEQHQASRYPLEGKHTAVQCAACHRRDSSATAERSLGTARITLRPEFAQCTSCHGADHGEQLGDRSTGGECGECHQVAGWTPASFTPVQHRAAGFPLEGRHVEVECAACHGTKRPGLPPPTPPVGGVGAAGIVFRVEQSCVGCHLDPHDGRFETAGARATPEGCLTCHSTRTFRPAAVDISVHAGFTFPLEGTHRAVPCLACHKELADPSPAGSSTLVAGGGQLRRSSFEAGESCASCHESVHGTQFAHRADQGRCQGCHDQDRFSPAARFDHDRDAAFVLGEGHRAVSCAKCHQQTQNVGEVVQVVYRPLSGKCEDCHTQPPAGRERPGG